MAKMPKNGVELGSTQLDLCIAFKLRLVAFAYKADLADPDADPKFCVEMDVIRFKPGDGTKRGRRGSRRLFYDPHQRIFLQSPNGKKPITDISNQEQVFDWVEETIGNLGNPN